MPSQNQKPLPPHFYCEYCGTCLIMNTLALTQVANLRQWGSATIEEHGCIDDEIHDEDTQEVLDQSYECIECEDLVTEQVTIIDEELQEIRKKMRQINQTRRENGQDEIDTKIFTLTNSIIHFTETAFNIIDQVVANNSDLEYLRLFNTNHEVYQNFQNPQTQPEHQPTPEDIPPEDIPPEENQMICAGHHQRWCRGLSYQLDYQCKKCNHLFLIDSHDDIICPACKHIQPKPKIKK